MRCFILSWVAGTLLLQQQADLPDGLLMMRFTVAAVCCAVLAWFLTRPAGRWFPLASGMLALLSGLLLGFCWAAWQAHVRLEPALPRPLEGRDLSLTGVVASLPQRGERGVRFLFRPDSPGDALGGMTGLVSLTWYHEPPRSPVQAGRAPDLRPGERWTLTVRLRRPHGGSNPHGPDFEAWALERNIRATGHVRPMDSNSRVQNDAGDPRDAVDRARASLRDRMQAALENLPLAGVLVALAIGDQDAIPPGQWRVYWRTGVGHLMSISGLHITMVSGLIGWLVHAVWARLPGLPLRWPAQRAAATAAVIAAAIYSLLAGFSIPTQRTLAMVAVVALAVMSGRHVVGSRVLCWALFVVTLADPWAGLSPGFWLSFGAIGLIYLVTAGRTGQIGPLRAAALTQWAVSLGMLPMLLGLFQEVSLISPVANAFAIPLVSLVVVPLTLAGAALDIPLFMHLAHLVMAVTHGMLAWLAALPSATWESHAPPAWAVALALIGVAWLLAPAGWPARWLGLVWLGPMFWVLPPAPAHGSASLTVLDVGQGLAVVVRTATHAMVFDTGPRWGADSDAGQRILVPHLRGEGIRHLDGLMVTHDDDDHAGGALSLLRMRSVGWMAAVLPDDHPLWQDAPAPRHCLRGDRWIWDGVEFTVLHPEHEDRFARRVKRNDTSCVLRLKAGRESVLLTADIERRAENWLVEREGPAMKSTVLLVPHHGSKTSSTDRFLESVAPRLAIISVGYRNRFRHPHPDVLARYAGRGIRVLRTDALGAITLQVSDAGISALAERQRRVRYWQDRAEEGSADP